MGFDIAMGACIKISDPDCPVCMEDGTYTTLDVGNDYEFCVCINGIATKIECPKDSPFNPDLGICYSNAPCDPSFCLNNKDYEVAENRNDTKSFCMCIDEKPIIVNCPNDSTFNPYIKKCSEYEISPKCLQSVCVDPKNNLKVFNPIDPKTSNGVCVCRQQMATFSPCNNGTILNPNLTICQLAEINCNSYQCRDLPDKTKIPALNTTDGYCECVKGIATYYNCPQNGEFNVITEKCEAPICDLTECKTPGQRIPASNTTDGFCDCTTGSYAPCPDGEKFGKFGLCKPPCIDLLCSGKPDQYLIPSSVNDHSFCMCHTTQVGTQTASYEKCNPTSYLFDETKQMCVANSGKLCGTDVCGADLGPKPAKDNSNGFCLCTKPGDKPVFKECLEGIYDDSIKACLKTTTEDVCDFTKCNFPNQRIAASNTTDGYCDCTMGYVSCPEGTKFGKYLMCMEPCTPELCTRKENNYVIESTVNDQSFCVCQTIATYEECEPKGFIFDKTQGTCVPNSEV
ncbi:uncharacterized protein LOC119614043, partial [Lucilia sericata]|uniref:uncharacterized protein LOC119614043 n=1 Tax=Lucilia sericata TaxID=13632 RepID=UPI0018A809DD